MSTILIHTQLSEFGAVHMKCTARPGGDDTSDRHHHDGGRGQQSIQVDHSHVLLRQHTPCTRTQFNSIGTGLSHKNWNVIAHFQLPHLCLREVKSGNVSKEPSRVYFRERSMLFLYHQRVTCNMMSNLLLHVDREAILNQENVYLNMIKKLSYMVPTIYPWQDKC